MQTVLVSYDSARIAGRFSACFEANLARCGLMRDVRQRIRFGLLPILGLAVLLTPIAGVTAHQAQPSSGKLLLATVVDASGKTVVDFGVDDFLIQEAGDEREILDVHVADYPIVVLIDDAPQSNEIEPIKTAIARFIARVGERPVAVGTLSSPSELIASLEDAREDVLERLSNMTTKPGNASTLPAVAHAARVLQDTGSPFSAIVVVTGRAIDARVPVEGDLLPSIIESGASVHVVESQASQLSSTDAIGSDNVPDLLRVLSDQTHGQYTTIFSSASYGTALDRLADKLSAELMIQYLVPAGEPGGDVRVGVRRPGARVVGLGVK
jgi:hypothetical protein